MEFSKQADVWRALLEGKIIVRKSVGSGDKSYFQIVNSELCMDSFPDGNFKCRTNISFHGCVDNLSIYVPKNYIWVNFRSGSCGEAYESEKAATAFISSNYSRVAVKFVEVTDEQA